MRNGQNNNNKRMRGRNNNNNNNNNNNRRNTNPLTRVYESNGPDVKIRGTANHIADKYIQLARDAQSSGDPVAAENYYQHAEHYFRLIATAQEQFRPAQPFNRQDNEQRSNDDHFDDEEEGGHPSIGNEPSYVSREQPQQPQQQPPRFQNREQSYQPRENNNYQGDRRPQNQPQPQPQYQPQPPVNGGESYGNALPSFITGGQPQPSAGPGNAEGGNEEQGDRFPMHRRRRRHRGPRPDGQPAVQGTGETPTSSD